MLQLFAQGEAEYSDQVCREVGISLSLSMWQELRNFLELKVREELLAVQGSDYKLVRK